MNDIVEVILTLAGLGVAMFGAVLASLGALRAKLTGAERSRAVEIYSEAGELLYTTSPTDESEAAAKVEVASPDDVTAVEVGKIVEAAHTSAQVPHERKGWLAEHGVIVGALVALVGVLFTVVWPTIMKEEPRPNCIEYARMLGELQQQSPAANPARLFGEGGLSMGNVDEECGPPTQFFEALRDGRPTQPSVATTPTGTFP
ncbi:MAG TPA: hypothetical protein VNQ73_16105 [Ilumatobacter sp.]|nr:hypothetical protein [Ilumatobacter sp.]